MKRTRKQLSGDGVRWLFTAGLNASFDREGWSFHAVVMQSSSSYLVLGLVTPAGKPGESEQAATERVFGEHQHKTLLTTPDLIEAQAAAADFVLHAPLPAALCDCTEAVPPKPVRAPRSRTRSRKVHP